MQPVIITAAVVGAEVTREQQPYLPVTPQEIITSAVDSYQAGAAVIHLHVRDEQGQPTQDAQIFARVVSGIRARCDVIVQTSTGGAVGMSEQERLQALECRPDMATLTMGSINFGNDVFENRRGMVERFARRMREVGVVPEIGVFDTAMIDEALRLYHMGLVSMPLHVDFTMGAPGSIGADAAHLVHLVRSLPAQSTWSVGAVGPHQLRMGVMALTMGGHVRVGMEDTLYYRYRERRLAQSNAELVERVVRIAGELERPVATVAQARKLLRLDRYQ